MANGQGDALGQVDSVGRNGGDGIRTYNQRAMDAEEVTRGQVALDATETGSDDDGLWTPVAVNTDGLAKAFDIADIGQGQANETS